MKKILIVSNFFYPEITPRAFRTTELVKGFCKKGWQVDLIIPNKSIYKENSLKIDNLTFIFADESEIKQDNASKNKALKSSKIKEALKKIIFYFFPPELFIFYSKGITRKLLQTDKKYDKIISISHPLSIHLSVALASIRNEKLRASKKIAEFSDPPFKGKFKSVFVINYLFIFWFSKVFDFFVVPLKEALPKFKFFKNLSEIKIIPQGVFIDEYKTEVYRKNDVPSFAYAGSFYRELRDPTYFFEYLKSIDSDFKFDLYIPKDNYFRPKILAYANQINGEIRILDYLPRKELIFELSKNDFLINFDNENSSMSPSKLIDYAITQRPILSFNKSCFDKEFFMEFLNNDFSHQINIDLSKYNMQHIIQDFIDL